MKWLKVGAVVLCAVTITALGIDAADTLQGSRSTLLGQLVSSTPVGVCPEGMVEVPMAQTFKCVDVYEASASAECDVTNPSNEPETQKNMNNPACKAASQGDVVPWRFITREQAVTACMRAGKRLPKADEWHMVSVGTPDDASVCNIQSTSHTKTGANASCVSALGVQDTVGNIWEWVADDIIEGSYQGRTLPLSGYVAQVDAQGVAVETKAAASELFYKDYFWSEQNGAYGMIRGGFYGSNEDAGVYSVHADTLPTSAGTAIGFRCVL